MATDPQKQPGIILDNVFLVKSEFHRESQLRESSEDNISFNLNVSSNEDNTKFVFLTCILDKLDFETKASFAKITVEYVAVLRKNETDPNMDLDMFSRKIAPSIIFPYIREHIHSTFLKAGIFSSPIQPINLPALFNEEIILE